MWYVNLLSMLCVSRDNKEKMEAKLTSTLRRLTKTNKDKHSPETVHNCTISTCNYYSPTGQHECLCNIDLLRRELSGIAVSFPVQQQRSLGYSTFQLHDDNTDTHVGLSIQVRTQGRPTGKGNYHWATVDVATSDTDVTRLWNLLVFFLFTCDSSRSTGQCVC